MLSIGVLVMLITGASALNTGDTISYASGTCPFESDCAETCTKAGYSVIKTSGGTGGGGQFIFTPKSASLGSCSCYSDTYDGTFSGNTFTGEGFTITTTSSSAVLSIPSSSCSVTFNIDGASSSTFKLNVIAGLFSATLVALTLA